MQCQRCETRQTRHCPSTSSVFCARPPKLMSVILHRILILVAIIMVSPLATHSFGCALISMPRRPGKSQKSTDFSSFYFVMPLSQGNETVLSPRVESAHGVDHTSTMTDVHPVWYGTDDRSLVQEIIKLHSLDAFYASFFSWFSFHFTFYYAGIWIL